MTFSDWNDLQIFAEAAEAVAEAAAPEPAEEPAPAGSEDQAA